MGPTTRWDVATTIMEKIKTLLVEAGADDSARNDEGKTAVEIAQEEAKAAAVDYHDMMRNKEELDRRWQWIVENERRKCIWMARLREDAARTHGARPDQISDNTLPVLAAAVGTGRGRGHLREYPTSISPLHRRVIAAKLDPHHPRNADGSILLDGIRR